MEETKDNARQEIFSERVKAGKRTYFFDVKATRSNDYYLTITESKRRYKEDGFTYEKHKIFLYKEDFDKFVNALNNTVNHVKEELMPEVDFSQFQNRENHKPPASQPVQEEAKESKKETTEETTETTVEASTEEASKETESADVETADTTAGIDSELKWE